MAEKKKILFVNYSLHSGGIEKSLVTLLSLFDYDTYDVDLQLFINEGMFLSRVPQKVNLLKPLFPSAYKDNIRKAFFALLFGGHPLLAFCRLFVSFAGLKGTVGGRLKKMWLRAPVHKTCRKRVRRCNSVYGRPAHLLRRHQSKK
mgnify:CR=1 FL=1